MILATEITLEDTGWGCTTTFTHRIYTDLFGTPFPVVAHIPGGYQNERLVYQGVPQKGWAVRIWSEGSVSTGWRSGISLLWNKEVVQTDNPLALVQKQGGDTQALLRLLDIVDKWRNGRTCHWPPNIKEITPVILPPARSATEALSALCWVWGTFPIDGEWQVVCEGGRAKAERAMALPGIRGRWHAYRPPVLSEPQSCLSMTIGNYEFTFSPKAYILASGDGPRVFQTGYLKAHLWSRDYVLVTILDTQRQSRASARMKDHFWVCAWSNRNEED